MPFDPQGKGYKEVSFSHSQIDSSQVWHLWRTVHHPDSGYVTTASIGGAQLKA